MGLVSARLKSDLMIPTPRPPGETGGFAKRVLIVDPDRKAWEVGARLLIAQGYVVHRIARIAEAPPRWPQHLYDLVLITVGDPASQEVVEFCRQLAQLRPPVRVALLCAAGPGPNPSGVPLLRRDQPASKIAEDIARLLR
jgi:CheY-like chemotaxis protein